MANLQIGLPGKEKGNQPIIAIRGVGAERHQHQQRPGRTVFM